MEVGAGRFRIAVVGASGYAGAEVVRLLTSHPCAEVVTVTSERSAGKPLSGECPWLSTDLVLESYDAARMDVDFVFLAQESGFAMVHAPELIHKTRIIDLSADFRLKDHSVFHEYYGKPHTAPTIEPVPVYGLPELTPADEIANATLIANPGCYPTASLLALMPLVESGLIGGTPVIDAKSGVSGAGRSKKETDYLFSELSGGFKAYAVTGHRHTPEIEQMAGIPVRFTPHLIPTARGLQATAHVPLKHPSSSEELRETYRQFYDSRAFVAIQEATPSTKQVQGSNRCLISCEYDRRTGFAVVTSVIDNLVKGAAGQAIQNMNIMAGLPETTGLPLHGVWP
jgi:N-acetyl-gamma-glutamyl-phosphate reductase